MYKLKIQDIEHLCTGCGSCSNICPTASIKIDYNDEGFYYPFINYKTCIHCKKCEQTCHVLNNHDINFKYTPYMCWSLDEEIRFNSSSGGVFTILSNFILKNGGVVYGARYNYEDNRLEHNNTDNYPISEFQKSKYIESNTLQSYREVKQFLDQNRWVMFCGTPCQIVGLRTFLRKYNTSKLLLVDFICHGVPSNKHFNEYLKYILKRKGNVRNIDFRSKEIGWNRIFLYIKTNKNIEIKKDHLECYYYRAFYDNLFLRKCCYKCQIINKHQSDITIGDFWGIHKYKPSINDNKGISLTILNSDKGNEIMNIIKDECFIEKLPLSAIEYAYKRNENEYILVPREKIGEKIKLKGYVTAMRSIYGFDVFLLLLKRKIKKILYYK